MECGKADFGSYCYMVIRLMSLASLGFSGHAICGVINTRIALSDGNFNVVQFYDEM